MTESIGVGIVGASVDHGWAFTAHVPAIATVPQLRIAAVSTTREESAQEAARRTGARPFTSASDLAAFDEVDLVVISVKVPAHRELVEQAVAAGKHVFSEWPLGLTTEEARLMTDAAARAGVRGFVGLQARMDPAVGWARTLVADGTLGTLIGLSVRSSRAKGGRIDQPNAYTVDVRTGAGNVEIHGGHLLDLLHHVVPDLAVTSGTTDLVRTELHNVTTDQPLIATAPDVFTAQLTLGSHGLGAATVFDGDPAAGTDIWLTGTDGTLHLWSADVEEARMRQPQMAPFHAELITREGRTARAPETTELSVAARNVAALYRAIAEDLTTGRTTAPTFADAVAVHEAIDLVRPATDLVRPAASRVRPAVGHVRR
ncbi:Gfo/Idh/MocA family protein [Luteipulveratus mongoliensis]|uniref:Gfo/Idh/MocA family protein n=1 Tax=Luteipulveratus mongoliensis TaxID=571913 RepID=UPI000695C122|nr:Gfo/Idh/MocA family oxidoreductase [Luteipulveratus mongoliensis]